MFYVNFGFRRYSKCVNLSSLVFETMPETLDEPGAVWRFSFHHDEGAGRQHPRIARRVNVNFDVHLKHHLRHTVGQLDVCDLGSAYTAIVILEASQAATRAIVSRPRSPGGAIVLRIDGLPEPPDDVLRAEVGVRQGERGRL